MKPMLFNTEMVRATLAGDKTATRRLIKPQPPQSAQLSMGANMDVCHAFDESIEHPGPNDRRVYMSPYKPGDILYVRETWAKTPDGSKYLYRANANPKAGGFMRDDAGNLYNPRWRPSIHMPRKAARIFLRVTSVRAERLWDSFGKMGAVALSFEEEGIQLPEECVDCVDRYGCPCCNDLDGSLAFDEQTGEDSEGGSECGMLDEVRQVFSELWDSTIEKSKREIYGSDADPWVWVIHYERCERPEVLG